MDRDRQTDRQRDTETDTETESGGEVEREKAFLFARNRVINDTNLYHYSELVK